MTRDEWNQLALRIEAATEGGQEIDWAIGFATGWRRQNYEGFDMIVDWEGNMFREHPGAIWPSVSESLDAITSLIGEKLPGFEWTVRLYARSFLNKAFASVFVRGEGADKAFDSHAKTPALALCAAFARAMGELAP